MIHFLRQIFDLKSFFNSCCNSWVAKSSNDLQSQKHQLQIVHFFHFCWKKWTSFVEILKYDMKRLKLVEWKVVLEHWELFWWIQKNPTANLSCPSEMMRNVFLACILNKKSEFVYYWKDILDQRWSIPGEVAQKSINWKTGTKWEERSWLNYPGVFETQGVFQGAAQLLD